MEMMIRVWAWVVWWMVGCGEAPVEPEAAPTEKCPAATMEGLGGQWVLVMGNTGNPKYRFEIVKKGETWEMWYVDGGLSKMVLAGMKRKKDYRFNEVGDKDTMTAFQAGKTSLVRLYVEPKPERCSLRISEVARYNRDGNKVEQTKSGMKEYLPFPEGQKLTFRPCDEPLFLGPAARNEKLAKGQIAKLGVADPRHPFGKKIPLGMWSDANADAAGHSSCSYDMDLFFDGQPARDAGKNVRSSLSASAVVNERRHWLVDAWYAPYSGSHLFEIYRYRTCAGGERTLIAVACNEASLQ